MIAVISNNIATHLGSKLKSTQDQIEVYSYGLQILLGAITKVILIIFIAWVLNTLGITLVLFLVFAAFRCFGGGAHLSTYPRCLTFGTAIIIGLGKLSQFNFKSTVLIFIFISTFIFAMYTCIKWVPAGTVKKQFTDDKIRFMQKKKLFVVIIIWSCIVVHLMRLVLENYALSAILGGLGSLFLITPWGYQLLETIDKFADAIGGEKNA
ncbi:MAG: accessory gene regulator B family protein [Syntrophomonas sp.]|nr:accessory gene regulator B family protein [Bacilli bacterium]